MALDELLDEHEQSERVLAWLRRNAAGLIGGVALGLGAIFAWNWWQARQQAENSEAATRYQQLADAFEAGDLSKQAELKALQQPIYRALGALALAKAQIAKNDREAAITTLRAIDANDPMLRAIVDERLARLLTDAGQAQQAIKLLASAQTAGALEALGDAHLALGQADRARETYVKALTQIDVGAPQRRLVELKLTQVGGTPSKPEAKS